MVKNIQNYDSYIKVFLLKNYGYTLARHNDLAQEGKDIIDEAEKIEANFPYWEGRKLSLFMPYSVQVNPEEDKS